MVSCQSSTFCVLRLRVALALLPLLLLAALRTQAGDIYRSVDADGHVVYSDRNSPGAQKAVVQSGAPHASDVARLARDQAAAQKQDEQRTAAAQRDAEQRSVQARERARLCDLAQHHYYSLRDARHVVHYDEHGNRQFYSDKEADAQREDALQAMQSACD
jgi:Domain of unknown function (DUF4124)